MAKRQKIFLGILIVIVIGAVVYFISRGINKLPAELLSSQPSSAYSRNLKRISKINEAYQSTLFSDSRFLSLKTFFPLPIEIGLVGNPNPFQPLVLPLELLLENIQPTP